MSDRASCWRLRRSPIISALLFASFSTSFPASAQLRRDPQLSLEGRIKDSAVLEEKLAAFYQTRSFRPLWLVNGRLAAEAGDLVALIARAAADGSTIASEQLPLLRQAVMRAQSGAMTDLVDAELTLSRVLVDHDRHLRRPSRFDIFYVDDELKPQSPDARALLEKVASASSLKQGLEQATSMNQLYTELAEAYATQREELSEEQRVRVRASLERLRVLPSNLGHRYVLVDAASARLWMYENGQPQATMRVIVGRPGEPTPIMAAYLRQLTLNPYWYVPPDLVARFIAPNVLREGQRYLQKQGYEVLSDWESPRPVPAAQVDWEAVAAGRIDLPLRQRPGGTNFMGSMKFMFPNILGVYLHDTPNKKLFADADRRLSAGCVRVEDAQKLAGWLLKEQPLPVSEQAEVEVPLSEPVPIYITYLTARAENGRIAFSDDLYGRDAEEEEVQSGFRPPSTASPS